MNKRLSNSREDNRSFLQNETNHSFLPCDYLYIAIKLLLR